MKTNRKFKIQSIKLVNGFTLIELLIVIAIIGILSSLLMVNFIAVRERARDAERKANLRQIQSALELYRADNGLYPSTMPNCTTGGEYSIRGTGDPSCGGSIYIRKVPRDPLGSGYYNDGEYFYNYNSTEKTYTLAACIENSSDSDVAVYSRSEIINDPDTDLELIIQDSSGCQGEPTNDYYYVLQNP
ncbi:MAG: prepilin-type N-terminal cleavage/methylation domain-containing protein [Candidatus Levybacteria bacterium]|nr:prepilin-type N-terminal cleavage/methylation domain-containing protein [Candidatus Levybacteria bacterium]MBI4098226.1 prepilin-type N-terminal cleavage/methylation domain-containing protein [Candidatus Levybacteria bacterium]